MSVVIRLMRAGAKKRPFFRMVAADSRRQRDGRFLEILGHYNPLTQPFELMVHKDRIETWISKGAQPSEQVASLLRSLGIPTQAPAPVRAASPAAGDKPRKRERKRTPSPRARPGRRRRSRRSEPGRRSRRAARGRFPQAQGRALAARRRGTHSRLPMRLRSGLALLVALALAGCAGRTPVDPAAEASA